MSCSCARPCAGSSPRPATASSTPSARCPARAALRARQGPHQRVVMAVHFRMSQADEWADKKQIRPGGRIFRGIRRLEREVIPQVDGLMYVSQVGAACPAELASGERRRAVHRDRELRGTAARHPGQEPLADLATIGHLEPVKNHRYMLEVMAAARRAGRTLTLDVYGEGPLRRDLLQQARLAGPGAAGPLLRRSGPMYAIILSRYRAYVHASYSESSSLAIIEAMAAGLPIVASASVHLRAWRRRRRGPVLAPRGPGRGSSHPDGPARLRASAVEGGERRERTIPP